MTWKSRALPFTAGLTLALSLTAVQARPASPVAGPDGVQPQAPRASADDIARNPNAFVGRSVSVSASVEDVYSPHWFSVDEDRLWSSGRDLLVLNPSPASRLDDGDDVVLTGDVRLFTRMSIEDDLDDLDWDIDPDLIVAFTNRPVLIARSVRTEDGVELVHESGPVIAGGVRPRVYRDDRADEDRRLRPAAALAPPLVVSADDLADDADEYYGRVVQVQAEVDDRHSLTIFSLEDDVVVVAPGIRRAVDDDARVTIVGNVTRFDEGRIELQVPGYRLDLLPEVWEQFDDRPVLIATSIRTEAGEELVVHR